MQPPDWTVIAAFVGAASGVGSLLVVIFYVGHHFGNFSKGLEELEKKALSPQEWGEIRNKVETLYQIYVLDALAGDRDGNGAKKRGGKRNNAPPK